MNIKSTSTFPKKIAIITSHTGAAVHDIIRVITKRNKTVSIIVIPVLVQENQQRSNKCSNRLC